MTRSQTLLIAGAILGGSLIISVGLYAGLVASRDAPADLPALGPLPARDPAPSAVKDPAPPPSGSYALARNASPEAWAPPPGAPALALPQPSFAEVRQKAVESATNALEADRWRYEERCWAAALRKYPEASPSTFVFNLAFDADGKEIARGIGSKGKAMSPNAPGFAEFARDPTQLARAEVHRCLQGVHDMPVLIPPPGRNIDVSIPVQIP